MSAACNSKTGYESAVGVASSNQLGATTTANLTHLHPHRGERPLESNSKTNHVQQPEDTLEYFIKFPHSQYSSDMMCSSNETEDFKFVYNETNPPVVMLLGWAGCQDRYLMKYSKIYEDRGLITVRYTAPVDKLFWNRSAMIPIGEKILKLFYDMNFETHPIIFHVFSNGGSYLYQHISLAMQKHRQPLQIRGMIFDSAPGERRMMTLFRAISAIYGKERKNSLLYSIPAMLITITLGMMWFVEETFCAFKNLFGKTEPMASNPFSDLKNEPNSCPQLYLYSKADEVIPYKDVEKFISIRREKGVETTSVCFEDAEHVKLYTKYPAHYINCVCTFINNCLAMPYQGSSFASTPTSIASHNTYKYD